MAKTVAIELRAMVKLHREMLRRLNMLDLKVVDFKVVKGHTHFTLELPSGAHRKITGAGSPSSVEHAIEQVIQTARRLLRADEHQPQKEPQ